MAVVMIIPRISPPKNAPSIAAIFFSYKSTDDDDASNYFITDLLNDRQSNHVVKLKSRNKK